MLKKCLIASMAWVLAACGSGEQGADQKGEAPAGAARLTGAGATFPAPLYSQWAKAFQEDGGVSVNYQPIGSGGGVKQIKAGTVAFGASDRPLEGAELEAAGLVQFPTVLGGVVPVVNVPGLAAGELKLTGPLLAELFEGKIARWNDPRLAAAAGKPMPNLPITVVHRSDGSGTTFVFTSYLSMKSPAWKTAYGAGEALEWPAGIGGKGNDGVAAYVKQTPGAIGYVEHAYAMQNGMAHAQLQNAAGQFTDPSGEGFAAAAVAADWAGVPGYGILLLDEPGQGAWPITAATFILVHRTAAGRDAARFFEWAFSKGDGSAEALGYTPLPAAVKDMVRATWAKELPAG
ncbi:MAG: phosphate ABC transporter substrate-binding protein PstS [Caulobacterales bacterium 32-69-10]|nr:MAG: phosphate ABC transporter substrate-binding protein PstS [Caulobacterales bacterium 32-69-10]